MKNGYTKKPLSLSRRAVIASATATRKKNAIHNLTEVNITTPRYLLKKYYEENGEKLSLTAYIVTCLARTVKQNPDLNSFIRGRKIVLLNDVTVSVLVERSIEGELVPEPVGIQKADSKSLIEVHNEIRKAAVTQKNKLDDLPFFARLIPTFLLTQFITIADRSIKLGIKYGKVAVTSVGMFSKEPIWIIPHGSATVLLSVGSIIDRIIEEDGVFCSQEHLCVTVSFDHNLVDGAPAARFMNDFIKMVREGEPLKEPDA